MQSEYACRISNHERAVSTLIIARPPYTKGLSKGRKLCMRNSNCKLLTFNGELHAGLAVSTVTDFETFIGLRSPAETLQSHSRLSCQ
jgi:hypothetical protein